MSLVGKYIIERNWAGNEFFYKIMKDTPKCIYISRIIPHTEFERNENSEEGWNCRYKITDLTNHNKSDDELNNKLYWKKKRKCELSINGGNIDIWDGVKTYTAIID